jgi:hypothetical protein
MAIVVIMRFLSQMAMLCHVGTQTKLLIRINVDSHAEDDEGGSKNESEIGEKLNRGHHENFNRTALDVGAAMVANAQIQTLSIPIRERN